MFLPFFSFSVPFFLAQGASLRCTTPQPPTCPPSQVSSRPGCRWPRAASCASTTRRGSRCWNPSGRPSCRRRWWPLGQVDRWLVERESLFRNPKWWYYQRKIQKGIFFDSHKHLLHHPKALQSSFKQNKTDVQCGFELESWCPNYGFIGFDFHIIQQSSNNHPTIIQQSSKPSPRKSHIRPRTSTAVASSLRPKSSLSWPSCRGIGRSYKRSRAMFFLVHSQEKNGKFMGKNMGKHIGNYGHPENKWRFSSPGKFSSSAFSCHGASEYCRVSIFFVGLWWCIRIEHGVL